MAIDSSTLACGRVSKTILKVRDLKCSEVQQGRNQQKAGKACSVFNHALDHLETSLLPVGGGVWVREPLSHQAHGHTSVGSAAPLSPSTRLPGALEIPAPLGSTPLHKLRDSNLPCPLGPPPPQRQASRLHSEIWRLENVTLLLLVALFCNYFIWESPSRGPACVLRGGGPAPPSLGDPEKPCLRHCDHSLSFIPAEAMYLWLNLVWHFRSHWYTSKELALLDQNRRKVWTWTSPVWTLRTARSGKQLLLDRNQERAKCTSPLCFFFSSSRRMPLSHQKRNLYWVFVQKRVWEEKIWSGKI